MKVREVMTGQVIRIQPEESVAVAARALAHYNIGALPVCGGEGRLAGLVTDRDIVTRCLAAGRLPGTTTVREVMTGRVLSVGPETEASTAAALMGREQVRRLPVVENGKLCGMLSLGDLATCRESAGEAAQALEQIAQNVSER